MVPFLRRSLEVDSDLLGIFPDAVCQTVHLDGQRGQVFPQLATNTTQQTAVRQPFLRLVHTPQTYLANHSLQIPGAPQSQPANHI